LTPAENRHEAPLSAEQNRPQTASRLSFPDGDQGWPQGTGPPPRPWAREAVRLSRPVSSPEKGLSLEHLRVRADFLRAQKGIRRTRPGITLEICTSPPASVHSNSVRVGFTASKKIGGAVVRNRAKRRLRAAAAAVLPLSALPGTDYVLVARRDTVDRPFDNLVADLAEALRAAHVKLGRAGETR
jgi:ribonuclease P protein component